MAIIAILALISICQVGATDISLQEELTSMREEMEKIRWELDDKQQKLDSMALEIDHLKRMSSFNGKSLLLALRFQ